MDDIDKLFKDKGYIEGITIINVAGEILFSAKFNSKMNPNEENYETVGKQFLDVYENLDENNSSIYLAMKQGMPVYVEDQKLISAGKEPINISSLSVPIKSGGKIVGAIDLSVLTDENKDERSVEIIEPGTKYPEIKDKVVYAYNKVESLRKADDKAVYSLEDIHTCDLKMIELKENIKKFAQSDLPVLIYGETGTGKELVAHSVHLCSKRANKPFIVQNCASIPANLIESILFGTSKGAFTGAVENMGLLELADGGTLFLDEINSMPLELQPKILRVIQDGTFRRVGGKDVRHVDVRIVSSTNEKLEKIVSGGGFRTDLYYRLAVLVLEIPSLVQRPKDIPLLTNLFVGKYNNLFGKRIQRVSERVYEELAARQWQGNVRELESVVASAVCTIDDREETLDCRHFGARLDLNRRENAGDLDGGSDRAGAMYGSQGGGDRAGAMYGSQGGGDRSRGCDDVAGMSGGGVAGMSGGGAAGMSDSADDGRRSGDYGMRSDFPGDSRDGDAAGEGEDSGQMALTGLVSEYEKKLIRAALIESNGNISKAAAALNVPRQTLSRKVKDYGLQRR